MKDLAAAIVTFAVLAQPGTAQSAASKLEQPSGKASDARPGGQHARSRADDLSELRGRVIGRVKDRDGNPWAGAFVTLLSRPWPSNERIGKPDLVRLVSDARGRFEARILLGRPYSVWAHSAPEDGTYRTTGVKEGVFPNVVTVLEEARQLRVQQRLRIHGLERWKRRAPFRFQLVSPTENVHVVPLDVSKSGECSVPPVPTATPRLEIFDNAGVPLASWGLHLIKEWRQRFLKTAAVDLETIELSAPRTVALRVVSEHGEPVERARLLKRVRDNWVPLGRTDENGVFLYDVAFLHWPGHSRPSTPSKVGVQLLVRAARYPELYFWGIADLGKARPTLLIQLLAGTSTIKGRIVTKADEAAAHLPLLVYTGIWQRKNSFNLTRDVAPSVSWTDETGRFEIGHVGSFHWGIRLCAVLTSELIQKVHRPSGGFPLAPVVWLGTVSSTRGDLDLGTIRIADLQPIDIQVTQEDGSPVQRPRILLRAAVPPIYPHPLLLRADGRGRLRVLANKTEGIDIAAGSGENFQIVRTPLPARSNGPGLSPLRLELPGITTISGTVFDSHGKAVPGTSVSLILDYTRSRVDKGPWPLLTPFFPLTQRTDAQGRFRFGIGRNRVYRLGADQRGGNWTMVEVENRPVAGIKLELPRK